jgi:plastocyanin
MRRLLIALSLAGLAALALVGGGEGSARVLRPALFAAMLLAAWAVVRSGIIGRIGASDAAQRVGRGWKKLSGLLFPPSARRAFFRAIDISYLPVFWIQITLVTGWLLLGASPAILAASPDLHARLHELGTGTGLFAEIAQNAALASHSASSWFQTTIDYVFSILNLTLAIFLVRHGSKQPAARLLAVGMGSTAVAFNLQGHSALLVIPQSWFQAVDLWHTVAIHTAAGIAYVFALLLFPDGQFVARRRLPYLFFITLLYGGIASLTAEDHIVGLVLLFGVFTPIAGLTSQVHRFRHAKKPATRRQSKLILVALSLALISAVVVGTITIALSSTNEEFTQTTKSYSFTAPAAGSYGFVCDPHVDDMVGEVDVRPRRSDDPTIFRTEIVAEDTKFDRSRLQIPAGSEVILEFTNKDSDAHNVAIYEGLFAAGPPSPGRDPTFANDPDPIFVGELFPGGDLADLLFRIFRAVFIVLPIALFVGILRLRLWDIDRLMNRALVYALLTGLLGTVYLGSVFTVGNIAGAVTGAQSDPVVVAISTLAVAALFRPARLAIQNFIDRRFYRQRYNAARTLESFSGRMRDQIELDSLEADLIDVVIQTMQPAHASLWLRSPKKGDEKDAIPRDGTKTLSQSVP